MTKTSMMPRCTCGPHPRIDLTAAYHDRRSDQQHKLSSSCREQIVDACRTHGCFHVTIGIDIVDNNEIESQLKCLGKARQQIEQDIESLFQPTSSCFFSLSDDLRDNDDCCWEDICNGGLQHFLIENEVDANNTSPEIAKKHITGMATFRGRVAESGDEQQSTPEPKLSWEFRRCMQMQHNCILDQGVADDRISSPRINIDEASRPHPLMLLPKWTDALHSVASTIIRLLGIPPQVVLQEERCRCCSDNTITNSDRRCKSCCNIDLLRVFRYDAVSHSQSDDRNAVILGSSPHSDWGTLTVVWQDDKGGLQTFCRSCGKWSDVVASTTTATTSLSAPTINNENGLDNGMIQLFVHVGDFLSLASIAEGKGGNNPIWTSPRHRVVCPPLRQNAVGGEADSCRRSLVYFAYPPPGISLDAAGTIVVPLVSHVLRDVPPDNESPEPVEVYDHYSLLHNQSHQSEEMDGHNMVSLTKQTYHRIKGVPFNDVIFEKWNQVQRKAKS